MIDWDICHSISSFLEAQKVLVVFGVCFSLFGILVWTLFLVHIGAYLKGFTDSFTNCFSKSVSRN